MDSPVKIDLSANLNPLIEAISDGGRGLCKGIVKVVKMFPDLQNKLLSIERKERLSIAQTDIEVEAIKSGIASYDPKHDCLTPVERVANSIIQEDTERMLGTLSLAFESLQNTPEDEINDEELDKDFWNKWRREAEIIDDEELRLIWAKLLTEEVKKPRSISHRTLDVVKNLSRDEAELFQSISVSSFAKAIFVNHERKAIIYKNNDFFLVDIMKLINAGLINPASLGFKRAAMRVELSEDSRFVNFGKKFQLHIEAPEFHFLHLALTTAGQELLDIIDIDMSLEQAILIAQQISSQNSKISFKLYEIDPESASRSPMSCPLWESTEQELQEDEN